MLLSSRAKVCLAIIIETSIYTSPVHKIPPHMIKAPFHLSYLQLIALSTTHMLNKYVTLAITQNMSAYGEQFKFCMLRKLWHRIGVEHLSIQIELPTYIREAKGMMCCYKNT